jgi:hypothetical protein
MMRAAFATPIILPAFISLRFCKDPPRPHIGPSLGTGTAIPLRQLRTSYRITFTCTFHFVKSTNIKFRVRKITPVSSDTFLNSIFTI